MPVVVGLVVAAALARPLVEDVVDAEGVQSWSTIFVAICIQAFPFLVLGVTVSGAIAAFVSPAALVRVLPRRPAAAVPVAAMAGFALPGCECGSVPIAGRLVARGVTPAAALTFLLAAPAINPIVLVATAVAFPGQPEVVLARFVASLLAACVVGFVWIWRGKRSMGRPRSPASARPRKSLRHVRRDGAARLSARRRFLVVGAAAAATLQTVVPRTILDSVAGRGLLSVLAMAGLAVALAVCSEADAFIAASLTQFSLTARLAFMVVGPMVDVKLIALQAGTFGKRFASFFAPITFVVCVVSALVVGGLLL